CIGPPLVDGNDLFVAFRESGAQRISLCALDAADGKKRWSLDLGTAASGGGEADLVPQGFGLLFAPQVRMAKSGGRIFVFMDEGATICVDPVRRRVCWAALLESGSGSLFSPGPRLGLICEGSVAYATFRGGHE